MKKKIVVLIAAGVLTIGLTGCGNQQLLDTTYTFDKAMIAMPNGTVIEGEVQSWKDWENSDTVQVKIGDVTYWTHSSNVVLMTD